VRQALNMHRPTCARHIKELQDLEYINIVAGTSNKGYFYQVQYWDDVAKMRTTIKKELLDQLKS